MTRVRGISVVNAHTSERAVRAGPFERRPGMLVRLAGEGAAFGIGEASPLRGYSPDSHEATRRALAELEPTRIQDALETAAGGSILARLAAVSGVLDAALPAARFALETAFLDLCCRQDGVSPSALLDCQGVAEVSVAAVLPELSTKSVELARDLLALGHSTLKAKLARGDDVELDILTELARLPVKLRVDANRRLNPACVRRIAPRLARLGIEFFEEPCPDCTSGAFGEAVLALALDESLQGLTPADLDALLDARGARVVVLKPMVLGGFSRCLELAHRARLRQVHAVVSHSFDGPVALHATCLLALCVQSRELAAGLAAHAGLDQWPVVGSPLERPGVLNSASFERPWLCPAQVLGGATER